ncbi:MAG: ubiquitin-like domain-containing protein [Candidatus Saccharimonadales bacterium]
MLIISSVNSPLSTNAAGSVVSIFVDGTERTVSTDAATVRDVLNRAKIEVSQNDLVEPGLDTEINNAIFNINVYRAKPFVVVDGAREVQINSAYRSPKLIVGNSAGVKTYPEDGYRVELIRDFTDEGSVGHKITVIRSMPSTLVVDGAKLEVRTHKETVGELLAENNIVISENDIVRPGISAPVKPNQTVTVTRVGNETEAEKETIARQTRIIYDDSKEIGWEEIQEPGKDGRKLVTYRVTYHNGREVERKVLQSVVLEEAVTKVVIKGNKRVLFANSTTTGNVELIVRQVAIKYGINPDHFVRIAMCESGLNPNAVNYGYYSNGHPSGLFQHISGYWPARASKYGYPGASVFNAEANANVSAAMWVDGQSHLWECQ